MNQDKGREAVEKTDFSDLCSPTFLKPAKHHKVASLMKHKTFLLILAKKTYQWIYLLYPCEGKLNTRWEHESSFVIK